MKREHVPEQFGKFRGAERLPLMTVVWVSNICNARCGHCPFTLHQELRTRERNALMPWNIFKKIVDDLSIERDRLVRITGSGEPFLNGELLRFVTYAKEKGLRVGLITNGSLLSDTNIGPLLVANTDIIEISVDAMDRETYAVIRVGLDFDRMRDGVLSLIRKRDELGSQSRIVVSIINQPEKLNDVGRVVEYWQAIADKVLLRKWITWNVLDGRNFTEAFLDPSDRVPCPWPFDRMHITTDGEVVFCADDLDRKHIAGNVLCNTLAEIWNGEPFERYRRYHLERNFHMIDICASCKDWPYKSWKYNYHKTVEEFKPK